MNNHILNIQHVSKFFGGVAANQDVSFSVNQGEILGLIGPNGAGKTTLFHCISGHYPVSEGDVIFEGNRVNGLSPDRICKLGMTRTWQKVRPLDGMTVEQNVVVGAFCQTSNKKAAEAMAKKCLTVVGLADRAQQKAGVLSIGDKKRLELARVLATGPRLVLLDEICGGLNHTETEELLNVIRNVRKRGVTVVFIEHDMKAVTSICDRIVVLNSGEKIAEGTPSEVMSNPVVIAAYLGDEGEISC